MFYFLFALISIYAVFTLGFAFTSFRESCIRAGWTGMVLFLLLALVLGIYSWAKVAGHLSGPIALSFQVIIGAALVLFTALIFLPLGRNPQALKGTEGMARGKAEKFNQKDTAFSIAHVGGYGPEAARNRWALQSQDPFGGLFWTLVMGLRYQVDGKVKPNQQQGYSPEEITKRIKEKAKYLGADLVGVTLRKDDFTYSEAFSYEESKLEVGPAVTNPVDLEHKYVVVLGKEMNYSVIRAALNEKDNASLGEIGKSYNEVAQIACALAGYIRQMGHPARAHHLRNDQIMHVPHAVDAGLGEQGRFSYLLSARYGPRVRLAAVTTDLGLLEDKPVDIGVQDFCENCRLCETNCPCDALAADKKGIRGYERWHQDQDRCFNFWVSGANTFACTLCINICPWNKPRSFVHKVSFFAVTRSVVARRALYWISILCYGKKIRWQRRPLPREVALPPETASWAKKDQPEIAGRPT
ncbi:MAG: 4Fe-4S dicluster domain-containing protein [Deltaproteobacteria bacterium]|nr:4Fe-4S dicluster domain-containing protein [Deltaproteobacteria bacterium]